MDLALAEQRLGDTLGRYTLTGVLGVGGMATVYRAVHRNGNKVALKLLHPHYATRDDVRGRFVQEAYTANRVEHPGAVRVLDDDVAPDGSAFMVMDLLEGETLDVWQAREGPMLPAEAVFEVVHQVLDVLVHAHARDIVHRDLKPENLHRASDGRVTVLDFGIARVLDDAAAATPKTRTGSLLGTPAFMPPEQAQGRAERIDGRTDLWALGATAFALLSGRYVHEADTVALLNIASGTQEARAIGPLVPGLPPSLAAIVDRALKFEQADRWRSARAMQEALESAFEEVFGRSLETPQQVALRAALPREAAIAAATEPPRAEAATTVGGAATHTPTHTTGAGVVSGRRSAEPPASLPRARRGGVVALVALVALAGATAVGAARFAQTARSTADASAAREPTPSSAQADGQITEAPSRLASATPRSVSEAAAPTPTGKVAASSLATAPPTARLPARPASPPAPLASATAALAPVAAPSAPAPAASPAKPSCDPWFILEDGKKRRKPWC